MADTKAVAAVESRALAEAASELAGFKLTKVEYGAAANIAGIRTKTQTFSSRRDSRTIFATDSRYGHLQKAGAWTGANRTAVAAGRRVLRAAKISAKEIAAIEVLSEMGQVAQRLAGDKVRVHKPTVLRKLARARRAVAGIPVWSSHATVGLNAAGDIGFLELHWPELPSAVVEEAGVLQRLVKEGFKPPALDGARPESVEAGIVHSPAIGFFMDVVAAVRVVYRGHEPTVGRKATLYLDRHGEPVALPRDIVPAAVEPRDRPKPKVKPPKKGGRRPR